MNKKFIRALLVILILMAIALAFMFGLLQEKPSSSERRTLCVSTSDDGQYRIEILAYSEPIFFGPQTIGIKIGEYGDVVLTYVGNDGKYIDERNFEISWSNHEVTIVIDGEEQHPVAYKISFEEDGNYFVERQEQN